MADEEAVEVEMEAVTVSVSNISCLGKRKAILFTIIMFILLSRSGVINKELPTDHLWL